MNSVYEVFKYPDPSFLITFHEDVGVAMRPTGFYMHWHDNIEILLFTSGKAVIAFDNNPITYESGDVAVINSNVTHHMAEKPVGTAYHCVIIDKRFCEAFSIPIESLMFESHIRDEGVKQLILFISREMREQPEYYKARVKAYAAELLVLLSREHSVRVVKTRSSVSLQKQTTMKKAVTYISAHFVEALTVEEIAEHVGLSKYYFCRAFKEVTGQRVFDYINMMRCSKAQKLLATGQYNISESAFASGFNNLSYFTRTYLRYMGVTPSRDLSMCISDIDHKN